MKHTPYLLAHTAAGQLGICVEWLRRLEREGHIPKARSLGRRRIYTEQELELIRQLFASEESQL